ncbi:hypothetical protein [Acanthamoeba castellanii mimivirus]|uniref:Uncharacterized protein L146 n=6 Tax=Mimivirus TaxID=315393 RepID=YL146_MIMIV|nr:hypothetical protein MIMI_gp0164 [Acanthamoeba polyphaga mimivirus]Q5URA2.1 RecName: Full=Uncharacterized protein L146 [Acanthamoeba polyphaga mimivirus]AEQ60325.1 hypothetical protein [Acanthamoeba castellanii mamavirus]AHA45726.1 hypothetical protein HIRU_S820 [Hirudovirus strain Sangsue]AHJ39929.1 hypothetical protein [Samba virus]ALR83657.1 hypothetical protein [Niemeyer virus]AMZ02594.1 hypothetical protein [Mimivirus Bombay]EJN41214.1 hypothetical protein lvs_L103 [Acanthamoeba poly
MDVLELIHTTVLGLNKDIDLSETKIYGFLIENSLTEIIEVSKRKNPGSLLNIITGCYEMIWKNHMDVIYNFITGDSSQIEDQAICLLAVKKNDIDIVKIFAEKGFDFNIELKKGSNMFYTYSIINSILEFNSVDLLKYLVENRLINDSKLSKNKYFYVYESTHLLDLLLDNYFFDTKNDQSEVIRSYLQNNICLNINTDILLKLIRLPHDINKIVLEDTHGYIFYSVANKKNSKQEIKSKLDLVISMGFNKIKELLDLLCMSQDEFCILISCILDMGYQLSTENKYNLLVKIRPNIIDLFYEHNIDLSNCHFTVPEIINKYLNKLNSLGLDNHTTCKLLMDKYFRF